MLAAISSQALFAPRAVALIGASRRPGSVGATILANLIGGQGHPPVYAVNPHEIEVEGATWCGCIEDLPDSCDLAILCIPSASIPDAIDRLAGSRGWAGRSSRSRVSSPRVTKARGWALRSRSRSPNCTTARYVSAPRQEQARWSCCGCRSIGHPCASRKSPTRPPRPLWY